MTPRMVNGQACVENGDDDAGKEQLKPSTSGSTFILSYSSNDELPEPRERFVRTIKCANGKEKSRKFRNNRMPSRWARRLSKSSTNNNVSTNRGITWNIDERLNLDRSEVILNSTPLSATPKSSEPYQATSYKDSQSIESRDKSVRSVPTRAKRISSDRRASQEELDKFENELQDFAQSSKTSWCWRGELDVRLAMQHFYGTNLVTPLENTNEEILSSSDSDTAYYPRGYPYSRRKRKGSRKKSAIVDETKSTTSVPKERPKYRKLFSMEAYLQSEEYVKQLLDYSQSGP